MDWQIIFSGLAFIISCVALWFSFAKYNKELYMKRKQEVLIDFYSALKAYQNKLDNFMEYGIILGDFDKEQREHYSDSVDNFLNKCIKLEESYKKFIPYLLKISKIRKDLLDSIFFAPRLEDHFIELKKICNYKKKDVYYYEKGDFSDRKCKIDCSGISILKCIEDSKVIEYLENKIIL